MAAQAEGDETDATMSRMAEIHRLKLRFQEWQSDKEPNGLSNFETGMSAVITSLSYGEEVEQYLDIKADRRVSRPMLISSLIVSDPDFALPVDAIGDPKLPKDQDPQTVSRSLFTPAVRSSKGTPATVRTLESLRVAANTTAVMKSAGNYFTCLSEGARKLDRMLYSVLKQLVKGSKSVILDGVSFPSYIQGICLMRKHCDINKNDRLQRAFNGVENIELKTDAMEWATTSMVRIRELLDSRAGITHYILKSLLNSLDGKCKTVQAKIAEDMAQLDPDDEVNIYDLLQTYATQMSALGYTGSNQVLVVEDDDCHYCGEKRHHARNCQKKKADLRKNPQKETEHPEKAAEKAAAKAAKKAKWKLKCTHCGKKGHLEEEC